MRARQVIGCLLLAAMAGSADARVEMAGVFSDHMVLQQGQPLRFYGVADPGEPVSVIADVARGATVADGRGRWRLELPARVPGRPFQVLVQGRSNQLRFQNVVVGEVWFASGQSNMGWPLQWVAGAERDILAAHNDDVRLYNVPERAAAVPLDLVDGQWYAATPETAKDFSALCVFFALKLQRELGVPVGVIHSSRGGSRIEPWIPTNSYIGFPGDQRGKVPNLHWAFWAPAGLFNGQVAALTSYPVRGVLWSQGESNLNDGAAYRDKLKALISGWRQAWQLPRLPFYFAQIAPLDEANFGAYLPVFWEAQNDAVASIADTAMIPTLDLNPSLKLHPDEKKPVGERFADVALDQVYGKARLSLAPAYRSHELAGAAIRIRYDHARGLRSSDGRAVSGFEIAGRDFVYRPAQARIEGETVLVSSPEVSQPVAVRYAWTPRYLSNLVNAAALPAAPFRTSRSDG